MNKLPILLVGAGGHARACLDVVEQEGRFVVVGMVGLPQEVGSSLLGCRILGTDADMPALVGRFAHALVAIGQIKSPDLRMRLFVLLEQCGCILPTIVSPRAYVSPHATLGTGTIVMHGAVINAGAVVGRNCIINSQALIEHDVQIADHCHVATCAAVNGGVRIGAGTFVGSHATVREGCTLGERCLIGMGQRVLADCSDGTRLVALQGPL